jgi:hypothetical protein
MFGNIPKENTMSAYYVSDITPADPAGWANTYFPTRSAHVAARFSGLKALQPTRSKFLGNGEGRAYIVDGASN